MSDYKSDEGGLVLPKLITARQVQKEYLNIDIRRLRALLNNHCHYRKIGRQYYYVREEVEQKLLNTNDHVEYQLAETVSIPKRPERRKNNVFLCRES